MLRYPFSTEGLAEAKEKAASKSRLDNLMLLYSMTANHTNVDSSQILKEIVKEMGLDPEAIVKGPGVKDPA